MSAQAVIRAVDRVSYFSGKAFAWLIVALTFVVSVEVFKRYILNAPTAWIFDFTNMLYGTLFMMCGAYTLAQGGHVRADFVYTYLRPRTQAALDLVHQVADTISATENRIETLLVRALESGALEKISGDKVKRPITIKVGVAQEKGKQIQKLDPTLKGTVERARERIEFHIDKLRRKAGRAQDQKTGLLSEHERYLESLLYPHKGPQERELCLLPFLARWGAGGLSELQKHSTGKKIGHHFIIQVP